VRFTLDDVDRVANAFPASSTSRPCNKGCHRAERSAHLHLDRERRPPVFQDILKLDTDQGRFFNGAEDQQRAHVCVIGSEAKTKLFSGGWALGETIRLNGV
jgi:putative ABC transport system permease protein